MISGYLITSLILKDLDRGTFSLADFWVRRIRRILPALLAVTAATALAGWFLLIPSAYASLGKSIVGLALLVSNVQFWRETGYFTATAEEKPLLHTWSLAVEEQFYLFVPVLLLLLARVLRSPARVLARRPGRDREPGPEHLRDAEVCRRDVLPAPHQGMGTLRRRAAGHLSRGLARRLAAQEGIRGDAGTPPDPDTLPPLRSGDAVPRPFRPRPRPGGGAAHLQRQSPRATPVGEPIPRLAPHGLRRPDLLLALPLALAALRLRQESDHLPALPESATDARRREPDPGRPLLAIRRGPVPQPQAARLAPAAPLRRGLLLRGVAVRRHHAPTAAGGSKGESPPWPGVSPTPARRIHATVEISTSRTSPGT